MIREISSDKTRIPELKREQVKSYIVEVRKKGLLDEEAIRPELKDAIDRYCPLIAWNLIMFGSVLALKIWCEVHKNAK